MKPTLTTGGVLTSGQTDCLSTFILLGSWIEEGLQEMRVPWCLTVRLRYTAMGVGRLQRCLQKGTCSAYGQIHSYKSHQLVGSLLVENDQ